MTLPFGNTTFSDGINTFAVVMVGVLTNHGLTDEQAVNLVNQGLDATQKQMNGDQSIVIQDVKK